jgi:hypothetical protein
MEPKLQPDAVDIWEELYQLKQRVSLLEQRVAEPLVKEEIAQYFLKNDGKEIGYEELIEKLKIDPKMVVQACNELLEEGKIG